MQESSPDPILQPARLRWQADGTPVACDYDDVYFSRAGALAESAYVFLRHNGLPARFGAGDFTIVETGFGTGLNALLTAQQWQRHGGAGTLHFISCEKHPLMLADLQRAHKCWPELAFWAERLQRHYPALTPGWHQVALADNVRVWLWFGDVHEGLADLDTAVDAWYLDGFAPARNPQMWTEALFQRMAALSAPGATFATFTAAGVVRRGLEKAGFAVDKVPGFGRKREMLCGRWPGTGRPQKARVQTLAVVGAGLAGAQVAYHAARAGVAVTVFEAQAPASGASGNWAGVFHPLVTADWSLRSQWYQLALESLSATLAPAWAAGVPGGWCELPHFLVDQRWQMRMARFAARGGDQAGVVAPTAPPCETAWPVWCYQQGGWVSPKAWVAWLLAHPGIELVQVEVGQVEAHNGRWCLHGRCFDALVWATGWRPQPLPGWPTDMLRPVAGQVERFAWADHGFKPHTPWVHGGYSVPMAEGLVVGATFVKSAAVAVSAAARTENYQRLLQACVQVGVAMRGESRVSVRPTTRDHMPIVGLWPEQASLGVSLGHGSRGILSTPLAAVWLCHDLGIQPVPQFSKLRHASRVERFFNHVKE